MLEPEILVAEVAAEEAMKEMVIEPALHQQHEEPNLYHEMDIPTQQIDLPQLEMER